MKKTLLAGLTTGLLMLGMSGMASASVLYQNGADNMGSGNNPFSYDNQYIAQDFTLAANSTINSLTFNAYTTGSTLPITNVSAKFYNDNGGSVGSMIFSGNFNVANSNATGNAWGYNLVDYSVNLPSISMASGHYWMALQVDPAQWDMHWSIPSSGNLGYGSYQSSTGTPGTYTSYGWEHSFRLEDTHATPEPATMLLLGSGLAGLIGARRKKKAQA